MREAFALQKFLTLFLTKNIDIYEILMYEVLTTRKLTMSLVLNNRSQLSIIEIQSTLVISTSVISNNRLSQRENLIPV